MAEANSSKPRPWIHYLSCYVYFMFRFNIALTPTTFEETPAPKALGKRLQIEISARRVPASPATFLLLRCQWQHKNTDHEYFKVYSGA